MGIAKAAIAALEQAIAHSRLVQVDDQRLTVFFIDLGADRNLHHGVGAAGPGHHLALAALAALGLHMLLEAVIDQGVEILHRFGNHIAAAPAVAAIRSAIFDELFTAEGDAAIAARSTGGIHLRNVEKTHLLAFQAACFRRKSARVNSMSWQRICMPRARHSRMAEPLWRAPSLARTCPEA